MGTTVTEPSITAHLVEEAIHHAAHLLPAQGPITVFIHHNTLHALEHLSFEAAVRQAGQLFGGEPFLSEQRYHHEISKGRISLNDISTVLMENLDERAEIFVGLLGTRFNLQRAMLRHPLHAVLPNQLDWVIAESRAFERFSEETDPAEAERIVAGTRRWLDRCLINPEPGSELTQQRLREIFRPLQNKFPFQDSSRWSEAQWESLTLNLLWQICIGEVSKYPHPHRANRPCRHRDFLYWQCGVDSDAMVNEVLVRFCIAMLDQGMSRWQLPERQSGIFQAFSKLYSSHQIIGERWMLPLAAELKQIEASGMKPAEVIVKYLEQLGVASDEVEEFITQSLLALRGFGGMVWQMEIRGDRIAHGLAPGSLVELAAIRLILDRLAVSYVASTELGITSLLKIRELTCHVDHGDPLENTRCEAFAIFQIAQALGWQPETLFNMSSVNWEKLLIEIRQFDDIERRKIFHLAYERSYRQRCFDAVQLHCRDSRFAEMRAKQNAEPPLFDVITCIDEREESFRRHLEEIEPRSRTWGTAGFFGVAMYYCSADSFQYIPLCPIVIEPQHYVQEIVTLDQRHVAERRTTVRRLIGKTQSTIHSGSRSLFSGAFAAIFGIIATVPLVLRVLMPRFAAFLREHLSRIHSVPSQTALHLERVGKSPGPEADQIGFSLDEMATMVERMLRVIGFTNNWSRLVIILGHGSTNMNNPHASAYDCGACGGGRGGPNSRAFTQMANDPRVRQRMAAKGFIIPESTVFVGGFHNTCNDQVTFSDLGNVPTSHIPDMQYAQKVLDQTSARNAHERCRRFESADLTLTPAAAYRHVMARSEDLSQVRPECGHATNAMCVVGRREYTRGLFMDRRAFLHSYDPFQDDAQYSILAAILSAVFPVCGGINLEYFFSYVDSECYGCGTKLPHNVTSLVGVMNGAASDLRPGLPWQMVEIHEPVRLLIIVETTPEAMLSIMSRNEAIDRMVRGNWVQLATLDAEVGTILFYQNGQFIEQKIENSEVAQTPDSINWYRGKRDHLPFAQVTNDLNASATIPSGTGGR